MFLLTSLLFANTTSVEHFTVTEGKLLALPSNTILGLDNLPVANTLAYLSLASVTKKTSFIRLKPGSHEHGSFTAHDNLAIPLQ